MCCWLRKESNLSGTVAAVCAALFLYTRKSISDIGRRHVSIIKKSEGALEPLTSYRIEENALSKISGQHNLRNHYSARGI
jgi:hypothetical protein